jgi:hypothetical protein
MRLEGLPGGDLTAKGLLDLEQGEETVEALLVCIAAPRLRAAGVPVLPPQRPVYLTGGATAVLVGWRASTPGRRRVASPPTGG